VRAVMVDEPGSIRVAEVPDPSPAAGQVLVRTYRAALDLVGSGALRSGTGLKVQVLPH
jgi:NADPH:quinone reductase-like Zn-dependent oxidoreductase